MLAQGAILTLESSQPLSCPAQKTTTQGTTTAAPPAPPKKEAVKATVAADKVGWFEAAPELMPRYSEPGVDRYVYVKLTAMHRPHRTRMHACSNARVHSAQERGRGSRRGVGRVVHTVLSMGRPWRRP